MIVVKVGGRKGLDYDAVCADVAVQWKAGNKLVLVHGGSYQTNVVAQQLGHPPQFVTSVSGYVSRRTDRRTLEIFEMVYCGKMNKQIVESLQRQGINANIMSLGGIAIFSGTPPLLTGEMIFADRFEGELVDTHFNRKLSVGYDIHTLKWFEDYPTW